MTSIKPVIGQVLPDIVTAKLGGGEIHLSAPAENFKWRVIIVYRGNHCPICTKYLSKLNELLPEFHELGVDVVAVSADIAEKAQVQMGKVNPDFEVGYNLNIEQMRQLGLYISNPNPQMGTDNPFAEPALYIVNKNAELQIIDISNAPFSRPELATVLMGLKYILNPNNSYPVLGTH